MNWTWRDLALYLSLVLAAALLGVSIGVITS